MDNLSAARALMGISLAFHIVYATIGIGLPLLLMVAEGLALKTGDEGWHDLARRWVRPAGVLFAIGAVSGTILSFELGLLWPEFMRLAGPLTGLAFSMEGFAFFTEAIFLALYFYGERRLSRRTVFLCTIPITVAAATSAVFVISANGWMNTPGGFRMGGGVMTDLHPLQAFANQAWLHEAVHGTLAAYVAIGFAVAGFYAGSFFTKNPFAHAGKALALSLAVASIVLPFMLLSGDWAADSVADHQKPKLAAMEALLKTTAGAPLVIGGWPDLKTGTVRYAIKIPKLLSVLAHGNPDALVEGLDAFPPGDVPDPRVVHPFFDLMVGSFFIMALASIWFWWLRWRRHEVPRNRALLAVIAVAAPFGMIALESGWMVTEFGRQPWVIQGYLRTAQGVTPHSGVLLVFATFVLVYLALTAAMVRLLILPQPRGEKETGGEVHDG